ncbi:MAG: hypothetical protein V1648_00340 [Candidatus Aenigmatarchaeota archaeon]
MVCYIIPLATGIITAARRKVMHKKDKESLWLSLMFAGASVFGVVDHAWNGELMMIGPNIASDLALGTAITAAVFVSWGTVTHKDRIFEALRPLSRITGILK